MRYNISNKNNRRFFITNAPFAKKFPGIKSRRIPSATVNEGFNIAEIAVLPLNIAKLRRRTTPNGAKCGVCPSSRRGALLRLAALRLSGFAGRYPLSCVVRVSVACGAAYRWPRAPASRARLCRRGLSALAACFRRLVALRRVIGSPTVWHALSLRLFFRPGIHG